MPFSLFSLRHIEARNSLFLLSKRQHRDLLVIHELYRQQQEMYDKRKKGSMIG